MKSVIYAGSGRNCFITGHIYEPVGERKGIIYFAHGVTEYARRHEKFFKYLCDLGYVIVANDHMGHGESVNDHPCYFQSDDEKEMSGWECAVKDAYNFIQMMCGEYPNLPVYGIGFSLGSFIVRHLAIDYPDLFKSIVLLGTGYQSKIATSLGKMMAQSEGKKHGKDKQTAQIDKLTFGTYNKNFIGETKADWLCSNSTVVKEYLEDNQCGSGFTAGLFNDLLSGMEYTCNRQNIKKMNKECPVLLLSGSKDPVGDCGKGVKKLQSVYEAVGISAKCRLYSGCRHDILHDKAMNHVYIDIANFIMKE